MKSKEELKQELCRAIDQRRDEIIALGERIFDRPELGYKEVYGTEQVKQALAGLGLQVESNIAVTGCRALLDTGKEGPRVAVMGELDAIVCPEHPKAVETGAVHACGHHAQIAALVGAAMGLVDTGAADYLSGSVDWMAVPAEEFVELEYRSKLKEQGKIQFLGGKQELIYRGYFDQVDLAMMIHSLAPEYEGQQAVIGRTGNGFIAKRVRFIGRESHAGAAPEQGINALNAAVLAMNNIHAQRETFLDDDRIRVHSIITKGGDIVNVVPADVQLETFVRGRRTEGILDANQKVNRSLLAGAMAVGAGIEITEFPGYLPLLTHGDLDALCLDNLKALVPEAAIQLGGQLGASFDFGDLSHLMPTLHPFFAGVQGALHTREFTVVDPETAYLLPAKTMAMTLVDLLWDQAQEARRLLQAFKPKMTKEAYLAYQASVSAQIKA